MASHSDSKSENSYLDEVEFKEKESEILLGLSNWGVGFHGRGHGKKVPSWSIRELLQHTNEKSRRGEGISRPEHSALAKYILSNDAMAHDRELGGVGNCRDNQVVKAHRDKRHTANRADKEAHKEKVLKK